MPGTFPESRVVKMWRDRLPGRTDLVTEDDEPVRIVYPGRLNGDRGADYRDAVIATSRGVMRGDVEIHVKSSSWWAHRHHQDPFYNGVILHVVFWDDVARAVTLQNGKKVPTLALHKYIEDRIDPVYPSVNYPMPCRSGVRRWDTSFMGRILDTAGEQRFLARVADFQAELARTEASQSLYQGIMGALGYSKNKHQMVELAGRMPLRRLEAAASEKTSDDECLTQYQARLVGMAGLLPSQRARPHHAYSGAEGWFDRLEKLWAACRETATMSEDDWHFFKVRPGNLPTRRIAAMCYLLLRFRGEGMLAGLIDRLGMAAIETGYREMERALLVTTDAYRGRYLDFGLPALLGRGRADDIVVNVVLPFAAAWGQSNSRPELAAKAVEIYSNYPVLTDNTLERHMTNQLGIGRYLVSTARRQQGLLHIYKTLCSQGKCRDCPIVSEIG
ncbi:MAG: DUF2851 family protein [Dehalococcoidales bacterium]|nr:DUF2851 family protein [Dehalococcoidales bacterium]